MIDAVLEVLAQFDLGHQVIEAVLPLFQVFRSETVAPTIATAMVGAAVFLLVIFSVQIVRTKMRLGACISFLKKCETKADFATRFDDFDGLMQRFSPLKHAWLEYSETLLPRHHDTKVVESTVRPGDFISLTEAEHAGLRLKWFHGLSNIFVGLGLLFTFIGLVAALYFAAQAINSAGGMGKIDPAAQTQVMQSALAQLLGAATFKFWTSIAGLGSSIVLACIYRVATRWLEAQFDRLCREIERCTLTVTPELLSHRQYEELREQSAQLKEFTGQLAFNLGKALEDALLAAMPPIMTSAMQPIAHQIGTMASNISGMNENALKTMAEEFGSVISANAGSEMRAVTETLKQIQASLTQTSEMVSGSGSGLSSQIADAAADLRAAASAVTEGIRGMTEAAQSDVSRTRQTLEDQLLTASQGLTRAAGVIKETLSDVGTKMTSATHDAGTAFANQIADAVSRIEASSARNAEAIQQVVDQLKAVATEATGTLSSETATAVQAMRGAAEQMANAVATVTDQLRKGSQEGVADLTGKFLSAAEAMQRASKENADRISQAVERIVAAGGQAQQGVNQAMEQVGQALDQHGKAAAAQVVSGAEKVLEEFGGGIDDLLDGVEQLTKALDGVETRINAHIQALENVNRSTRDTEGAISGTARALREAAQPLTQAGQAMSQAMANVAQTVDSSTKGLAETQRQGALMSAELRATFDELQRVWNRHESRFDQADEKLAKIVDQVINLLNANATNLQEHVGQIDSALADTVNMMAGNIEELTDAAAEFARATKSLERVR